MIRLLVLMGLWVAPSLATAAPPVVISTGPSKVGVTIYQDPDRGNAAINTNQPSSLAFIYETRTVVLPAGPVTVRFEGVAGGIIPQSAIMMGTNPRERNRDGALLSQGGLVDAFTGQQVLIRRTDRATGQVLEEPATIRSAGDRLIIMTPRGAETVYCTGLAQTLIYPQAPATLSAKPVLSMTTKDQPGGTVTITLAYLATGFDWEATYVGTLSGNGKSLSLFSWLTIASGDETSFLDATTSAVAGRINRASESDDFMAYPNAPAAPADPRWGCWPSATTSDIDAFDPSISEPPEMEMMMEGAVETVIVTGSRMMAPPPAPPPPPMAITATTENLGDLKLFRIPIPVTVAARSQKQVGFLASSEVKGKLVYRSRVYGGEPTPTIPVFHFRNDTKSGLGKALPAGGIILYQNAFAQRQLIGESRLLDKTINEDVDIDLPSDINVFLETKRLTILNNIEYKVTIHNRNNFPIDFEMEFLNLPNLQYKNLPLPVKAKLGKKVWSVTIPADSARELDYDIDPSQ